LKFNTDIDSFTEKATKETTSKPIDKILNEIKSNPSTTISGLAKILRLTDDGIKYHINKLKSEGVIRHIGARKSGRWEIIKKGSVERVDI